MPAHIISLEQHTKLLESFREHPGRLGAAARKAGISHITAKKYWEKGNPDAPDIRAKPISQIITEEQEASRARMYDLQKQVDTLAAELEAKRRAENQAKAQLDATDTRVQEAQVIRMARGATQGLLVTLTNLSKGAAKVGVRIAKNLDRLANDPADMSRGEIVDMVRTVQTLTSALRQANDAGRQAMEMERLLLGEPTAITQHNHIVEVTVDEAERRIQAGLRALARAKDKGLIVDGKVLPGPGSLPTLQRVNPTSTSVAEPLAETPGGDGKSVA